jgi:Flp pilus assembly protein TadG
MGFIRKLRSARSLTEGSQLAELAVSLPLLVIIMIGIIDFGGAFSAKHKLDIAIQQAARTAANQTMADITNDPAKSTEAIRGAVVSSLIAMKLNDCGVASSTGTKSNLMWTYTGSSCVGTLTLEIDRGNTLTNPGGTPELVEATRVTLLYPYQWRLSRAIQLLIPGASFTGPTQLRAEAISQNLN